MGLGACAHGGAAGQPGAKEVEGEGPAPHLRATADAPARPAGDPHAVTAGELEPAATDGPVGLEAILAYADSHSPLLAVARSTRARASAARAGAAPALPANPTATLAVGPRLGSSGTGVDIQATFMQQVRIAGERGLLLDAADRLKELTDAEIEQVRWSVHCDVHAAFHRALVERERAKLATSVVAFQEEVLRVVQRQIGAGEAAPLTLRLAEAEAAQSRQAQVAAEQGYLAAQIRLAQLSGWPADRPPIPEGQVDEPREPPGYDHLLQVAHEHLPALHARQAAVREAQARASAADRQAWVNPSVGIQYQREGNQTPEGPNNIIMGVLSVPIPGAQMNQGERAEAHADVGVANAELDARRNLLQADIATARSEVVAASKRARAYGTEILPRFEENLTLLRRAFELGEIDLLALLVGRERFLRIQSDAFVAHLDYFVALASLERVVGVDLWHDAHDAHDASDERTSP